VDLLAYPWRSVRSLCLPGLRTFARETLNARWGVVWLTLFALPLLSSLIALLLGIPGHHITSGMLAGIPLVPLIVIPILFFIVQGMIWPLARHYQGGGTFLEQCYTTFLPLAPLFLVGSVVSILLAIDSTSPTAALLVLIGMLCWCWTLAGWHKSGEVLMPEGIHLLLLPPYSPELQRGSTSLAAHKRSHRLSSLRVA